MRIATLTRTLALVLGAAGLLLPRLAGADIVGGSKKAGCAAVFKGIDATKGKTTVECEDGATCDGDNAADQACVFPTQVCLNVSGLSPCVPSDVATVEYSLESNSGASGDLPFPPLPSAVQDDCGEPSFVVVPIGFKNNGKLKPGKVTLKLTAKPSSGKPDKNKIKLVCKPGPNTPSTTSTTIPPPPNCPNNGDPAAGNPNTVITTMLPTGSDLDSGWTGTSFNFPVIQDVQIAACLQNCNKTTDSLCDLNGPSGANTFNSATLGPPLPLVAGGVGVCVVNEFQNQGANGFTGTVDLATGATNVNINLFSDVYLTDRTNVCPRCETGRCDGGPNKGRPCTVHGTTRVEETLAPNKVFKLSRDCPPASNLFLARLNIPLATTTGTVNTPAPGGSKPCTENQSKGVTTQDDNCGGSGCSAAPNCSGKSCVTTTSNPVDGSTICVDSKGGLSQLCCNGSNSQVPCHPTAPGGAGIVRTGRPVPNASPAPWPDPQYPKTASGSVLVSTFCIPPTGTGTVDITTGLPGPGALIFNTDAVISVTPPTP
jgi:hypothetical protein